MSINKTLEWFQVAIPAPTIEHACVQIGVGYEETSELASVMLDGNLNSELELVAHYYKNRNSSCVEDIAAMDLGSKIELLDAIIDEIVTRVGIGHCMGFDVLGALEEVNRANWSKFEDGKPVFDANGKIAKGKNYTKPDLAKFIK